MKAEPSHTWIEPERTSYFEEMKKEVAELAFWRGKYLELIEHRSLNPNANNTRLWGKVSRLTLKIAEFKSKIARIEREDDVEMWESGGDGDWNTGEEESEESKMGEDGKLNTGEEEREMKDLTAGVAKLCN